MVFFVGVSSSFAHVNSTPWHLKTKLKRIQFSKPGLRLNPLLVNDTLQKIAETHLVEELEVKHIPTVFRFKSILQKLVQKRRSKIENANQKVGQNKNKASQNVSFFVG